jgi:hypothetical protein
MADNLNYTEPGSGTEIATDDVSGVHYQYVKLADGTPDSSAYIPGDASSGLWVNVKQIESSCVAGLPAASIFFAEDAAHADGDRGIQALTVRQNTAAALAGSDGDYQPLITDNAGRLHVATQRAPTATLSNVNDTASSTTLLSANANRIGATIVNDSTEVLFVKLGTTASATSFTKKMAVGEYWEVPFGYTGRIDGIWANDASGAARITEIT